MIYTIILLALNFSLPSIFVVKVNALIPSNTFFFLLERKELVIDRGKPRNIGLQ